MPGLHRLEADVARHDTILVVIAKRPVAALPLLLHQQLGGAALFGGAWTLLYDAPPTEEKAEEWAERFVPDAALGLTFAGCGDDQTIEGGPGLPEYCNPISTDSCLLPWPLMRP